MDFTILTYALLGINYAGYMHIICRIYAYLNVIIAMVMHIMYIYFLKIK